MVLLEYVDEKGRNLFRRWLASLKDRRGSAAIDSRLTRLRLGNLGDSQSVGAGVSELKVDVGPGYRIYFGREGDTIVVLLVGGDKSTQARDIKRAQKLWASYMELKR